MVGGILCKSDKLYIIIIITTSILAALLNFWHLWHQLGLSAPRRAQPLLACSTATACSVLPWPALSCPALACRSCLPCPSLLYCYSLACPGLDCRSGRPWPGLPLPGLLYCYSLACRPCLPCPDPPLPGLVYRSTLQRSLPSLVLLRDKDAWVFDAGEVRGGGWGLLDAGWR